MKILNIIQRYPPSIGGSETWCQGISRYASQQGHNVTVLTLKAYNEDEFWKDPEFENCQLRFGNLEYDKRVKVMRCSRNKVHPILHRFFKFMNHYFNIYLYGPHSIQMYSKMLREIKKCDIVHLYTIPHTHNLFGFFMAKLFKKKVVLTPFFHIGHHLYETRFHYWLMKSCDAIFALTNSEKEHLISKGVKKVNISVVGCAINPEEYKSKELDKFKKKIFDKFDILPETKIVIFIGRKIDSKGIKTLIDAVKILRKEMSIKLLLIGPNFQWYEKQYASLSEDERKDIIDLGIVSEQTKVNFLHISHLLVLPSGFESFGVVFLEAWICGLPVVGTRSGVMAEVIGDSGVTFKNGDTVDLENKIQYLLFNFNHAKEMANNGKKKIFKSYLWDSAGKKILEKYSNLTAKKKSLRKYKIEFETKNILGEGWYGIENDGFHRWSWSKERASLNFPANNKEIALEVSGLNSNEVGHTKLSVFDSNGSEISKHNIYNSQKQVEIPKGYRSVTLKTEHLLRRNSNLKTSDSRLLGVCLHGAYNKNEFKAFCEWSPKILEIETTTMCNMNPSCAMCTVHNFKSSMYKFHLSKEILERIKFYLNDAHTISLHGSGEPLLTERLFDILEIVSNEKIWTTFNTNGLLLTEEMSEKLISKCLKQISFSLDAATPETYRKIRRNDNFDKVKSNIKHLTLMKKKNNTIYPRILINMILMKENFSELLSFVSLAHELGAVGIYLRLLKHIPKNYILEENGFYFNYRNQMLNTESEEFKENILNGRNNADTLGIKFHTDHYNINKILEKKENKTSQEINVKPFCRKPWENIIVEVDGNLRFCCHMERNASLLGHLNDSSFEELWNSKKAVDIRRQFLNGRLPMLCRNCPIYS